MVTLVRLLGEVGVDVDGQPVDLGSPRQRCVLAALAVDAGRVVPVGQLVERVWGLDAAPRTRSTLHNYISRLRGALAGASCVTIVRRSSGYALITETNQAEVDLDRFHGLRAAAAAEGDEQAARLLTDALRLWTGQALTGVDSEWAEAERSRLARERLTAEHDLTDAVLRLGRGSELVVELGTRAAEHPLDERVGSQYVLALHQAGRTADALEHHRLLRDTLVEELGTEPGAALRDLHRRILASDPALCAPAAGDASRPVAPSQLPAAPGLFTGRAAELAELDRALRPGDSSPRGAAQSARAAAVISAIGGTGGIGKTWLALTWAHRNLEHFPDGQLSVDLRGFSPGDPKLATDVLADFLAALGVDRDHHPSDPDARAALYRTHTAGKRLLILLDNAATSDQVVPLLPGGSSCTVLVTSRHRLSALLTRHGAHPLQVHVFSDTEARVLLETAFGDSGTAAAQGTITELIALCGGFPLALGLIAAQVRTHPHLVHDIVGDLRELGLDALGSDDPDASLPVVLSWSLRHLTDEQRTAFALLGIAPGPDVDLPAATCLIGRPALTTRAVLRGLVEASLVVQTPGGRYAMHDLVRAYAISTARDCLSDQVRAAALNRVVDFYLHTAHAADRLLEPSRVPVGTPLAPGASVHPLPDLPAALNWLDTHHRHLLAAQHIAAAQDRHDVVWHLAWALGTFHIRRGHRYDDLSVWQAAAGAAVHLPDPATRALAHRLLGRTHASLGQHEQAISHLRESLALAERHRDLTQQGHTHHVLTWVWEQRGDDQRAFEHALHALSIFRTLDQPVWEADILNSVGWFAARLGDYDTARDHCQAALALCRRHHNPAGEANTLDSLGFIAHLTHHHDQAVEYYEQALSLFRSLGDTAESANSLDRLGHSHSALGHHDDARTAWKEALDLYWEQGRGTDADRVRQQIDDLGQHSD